MVEKGRVFMFPNRPWCWFWMAILLCLSGPAYAEIRPSFDLNTCAWKATHVVVVDAKGVVIESWKGDLASGTRMPTDTWQLPATEAVYYGYSETEEAPKYVELPKDAVRRVSSDRRVLFLKRQDDGDVSAPSTWKSAGLFGANMSASVAWIENGRAFAMQQWINPGPVLMHPLEQTEGELRAEVLRLTELQQDLRAAAKVIDPLARAERLVSFLRPADRWTHLEAIDAMKGCGKPAWRVVRRLLTQQEHLPIHHELVFVAMEVAGAEAFDELERIVREESSYWGWLAKSDQTPVEYNPPMSDHFSRLSCSLSVLKRLGYRDPKGIVAKLRTDWDADPRLAHLGSGDGKGRSPVLRSADEILKPR